MLIYSRRFMGENMRRSKILVACWILAAIFFGSCDRSPEAKLAKHVKRGDEYVKEEKFKEAVIEYKNAVKAGPNDRGFHAHPRRGI